MRRSGMTWATIGLVSLAVVALVLAFAAMRSTRSTTAPEPLASALTNPTDKASDKGKHDEGVQSTQQLKDALPGAIESPLLMVSPNLAYRARTGTCLGGATLQRSTDGGVHWSTVMTPASAILSLSSVGGDAVEVVGADERCALRTWSSGDRGDTWSDPTTASDVITRVPNDPSKLSTPSGEVKNPCHDKQVAPVSVEGISEVEAVVLCASGDIFVTSDAGVTWSAQMAVAGGQALSFEGPELGWALQRDSGRCPALAALQTQDAGITWKPGGCVGLEPLADSGRLPSLSFADPEQGMADVEGVVYVTSDSGLTWNEAS